MASGASLACPDAPASPRFGAASPYPGASVELLAVAAVLLATLCALDLTAPYAAPLALASFSLCAGGVLAGLSRHHPHPHFGLANAVTLVRAGGMAIFVALAFDPAAAERHAPVAALGVLLLVALDGIDGTLARRQGLASDFGARFDMEVDAGLILALSAIVFALGAAGAFVLAIGLMRYGFVLAGLLWPVLARPLPPSRRRQAVCVFQVATLGLLILRPPLSQALAAAALGLLTLSFALDILWLLRRRAR